jgi:hypothetical protein
MKISRRTRYRLLVSALEKKAEDAGGEPTDLQRLKLYMAARFNKSPVCPACQAQSWEFAG